MNMANVQSLPSKGSGHGPPLLCVDNVTIQYRTREHVVVATQDASFNVHEEDRFILLGPSGCGKSTLLKAIAGFIQPARGQISLKSRLIDHSGPDRMMVFQEFEQLLPWKTVKENVMFPLRATGTLGRGETEERALDYLGRVGLSKFVDAYPHMLSGGMKQRVAIARAMAMKPAVLLMDEPFAALDALTRRKMQEELLQLWEHTRFTMVFVTHSIEEAIVLGSRILVLSPHPGRVRAELNADRFTHDHQGGEDFVALHQRIHAMLFNEPLHPVTEETAP